MNISGTLIKIVSVVFSIAAAYFLTIQSLKMDVASKADDKTVEVLNRKLTNIEIILKEAVVSREQFYIFSKDVENRLSRIEYILENKTGESIGKN